MLRTNWSVGLRELGHTVVEAANGAQALEHLAARQFDAIIVDILLPDTDGVEVIIAVKKRWPNLHVIAISGGGALNVDYCLQLASALGANKCLKKPIATETLSANLAH